MTPEYPVKRRCDVTPGEEWRGGPSLDWHPAESDRGAWDATSHLWVEVRPKQQPDPDGIALAGLVVTTVDAMRDRTDLDQWEAAVFSACNGWSRVDTVFAVFARHTWPDDFPVIVRRKADK